MHNTAQDNRQAPTMVITKPHIVLLPSPGMGHVTPMLELAKRLVLHHDCHVTFLHITTQASDPQTHLLRSSNLPSSLTVLHLPRASATTTTTPSLPVTRLCVTLRDTLLRSLKPTLSQLQQKPQALIADLFCTQALDTCTELSIPSYILYPISARFLAFAFSLLCPHLNTSDLCGGEFVEVPGCAPIRAKDLPHHYDLDDEWYLYHLRRVLKASGVFVNTYEELEPIPVRAVRENPFFKEIPTPPVFPIGPLVKETEPVYGTREECLAWLDKQASGSVVYVALGSGGSLSAEQLTELAWGLELSQQRFLWVARAPTKTSDEIGISFLNDDEEGGGEEEEEEKKKKGPECYLPQGFLERTRGMGMVVESWAPQVMVLQHVATGAFLSHCGWNSVLESVCNGVPLIAWPLFRDQMVNATMAAEEMGVAVKPVAEGMGLVGREEVERVVRAAMEGEEGKAIRAKAKEVKESALKRGGRASYEALAAVANQWKARSL